MAQMTRDLALDSLRSCSYGKHPALTVNETEQLLRAWLDNEVLRHEVERNKAMYQNAVRLLTSIHALMYPAPMTLADGRVVVFRPKDPDPHTILQNLSDRIRALPDELAKPVDTTNLDSWP